MPIPEFIITVSAHGSFFVATVMDGLLILTAESDLALSYTGLLFPTKFFGENSEDPASDLTPSSSYHAERIRNTGLEL